MGTKGGGAYWKLKKEGKTKLPEFISVKSLEPYVGEGIKEVLSGTVSYISVGNNKVSVGLKAGILPKICDIWVKALNDGVLTVEQRRIAKKAYILLSAFAKVGITALIDEATGFQKEKDEYLEIVKKYIAKELQPWIKRFGDDYYQEIYRLKGWDWTRFAVDKKNHPWAVSNITNRIVYEKLPDGVLEKLKELSPANEKGNRPNRLHQHLTPNEGQVHLLKHLGAIVNIMEGFEDGHWEEAVHQIDKRFPSKRIGLQKTLPLNFHFGNKAIFNGTLEMASKTTQPKKN